MLLYLTQRVILNVCCITEMEGCQPDLGPGRVWWNQVNSGTSKDDMGTGYSHVQQVNYAYPV